MITLFSLLQCFIISFWVPKFISSRNQLYHSFKMFLPLGLFHLDQLKIIFIFLYQHINIFSSKIPDKFYVATSKKNFYFVFNKLFVFEVLDLWSWELLLKLDPDILSFFTLTFLVGCFSSWFLLISLDLEAENIFTSIEYFKKFIRVWKLLHTRRDILIGIVLRIICWCTATKVGDKAATWRIPIIPQTAYTAFTLFNRITCCWLFFGHDLCFFV